MRIIRGPYLQRPDRHAITVMWQTDCKSHGTVKIYPTVNPHNPQNKITISGEPIVIDAGCDELHKVRIEQLSPDTEYCYEVLCEYNGQLLVSDRFPFRLAPDKNEAVNFVVTAEYGAYYKPVIERMHFERPDFILSLGDLVDNGTIDRDWDTYFFTYFNELIRTTPMFPCVGNHEVGNNAAADQPWRYENYLKIFDFPRYYSFDYGCAHFCVLDAPSMCRKISSSDTDKYIPILTSDFENSEQIRFLKADLAASDAKWKFVVFHYPPYTSSIYDVRELRVLSPIFEEYGVDIVFNSHAIVYERSHPIKGGELSPDGVRYIVVGSMQYKDPWFRPKSSRFSAKLAARPSFLSISLTPWRFELQSIDLEGKLIDSLTIEKNI